MDETMKTPLLTIAIPTYKRAAVFKEGLERLYAEWSLLDDNSDIEIIVSDNNSPDNTSFVVQEFISKGLPIKYIHNNENIGGDANILQCYRKATGRFVWVIGDDDYVNQGSIEHVMTFLRTHREVGVVYLRCGWIGKRPQFNLYDNPEKGLAEIGVALTFISANIVNKKFVDKFSDMYLQTMLSQVAFFLEAGMKSRRVAIINRNCLIASVDEATSGGYNRVQIIVANFLGIWKLFCPSRWYYELVKYDVFRHYLVHNLKHFIFNSDRRFKSDGAMKLLFKYYWPYPYFYAFLAITPFHSVIARVFRLMRGQKDG